MINTNKINHIKFIISEIIIIIKLRFNDYSIITLNTELLIRRVDNYVFKWFHDRNNEYINIYNVIIVILVLRLIVITLW